MMRIRIRIRNLTHLISCFVTINKTSAINVHVVYIAPGVTTQPNSSSNDNNLPQANNRLRGFPTFNHQNNKYNQHQHQDVSREAIVDLSPLASALMSDNFQSEAPQSLLVQLFQHDDPVIFQKMLDWTVHNGVTSHADDDNVESRYWYGESDNNDSFNIEINNHESTG